MTRPLQHNPDDGADMKCNDPVFLRSRREGRVILAVWVIALVWVVGFSFRFGYQNFDGSIQLIWGIPSWVFWGVAFPWGLATVWSIWFGLFSMSDDDLAEGQAERTQNGEMSRKDHV